MNTRIFPALIGVCCLPMLVSCSNGGFFEKFSGGYKLTFQTRPDTYGQQANVATPQNPRVIFSQVQICADSQGTSCKRVYSNPNTNFTENDFLTMPDPGDYKQIAESQIPLDTSTIGSIKVYLKAVLFSLNITDFNHSGIVANEEQFGVFYSSVNFVTIAPQAGDIVARTPTGDFQFFDTTQPSAGPLSLTPTSKKTIPLQESGVDAQGAYFLISIPQTKIGPSKISLLNILFDFGNSFRWVDVASGAGVFDAASPDVFNWSLMAPISDGAIGDL
jgi:hypothetical protein